MSKAKRRRPQPPAPPRRDLVILAADKDTAQTIEGLLSRSASLQIRAVTSDIIVHPQHDPGCLGQSPGILAVYLKTHSYALVVFDREGCGQEKNSRASLEADVQAQLSTTGWQDRSAAIVIDPELERWVWSQSPHVSTILGWRDTTKSVRQWLVEEEFLEEESQLKPDRPKEAMVAVLRHVRKPRSSAIYRELAEKVSLTSCEDASFLKFRETLQGWFRR
jgi:hypothetical protein